MATVVQPIIEPNRDAILSHLTTLFEPAQWDYPAGLIEIAHGAGKPDRAAYFACTDRGIAEAADHAAFLNRQGQNVYVGVNPRKSTTSLRERASDRDVEIAFFQFADLDKAEAVAKARGDLPVKPTMIVMTGTIPNNRPHLYWRLDEPVANLTAWTERQRGIAQTLEGDAVINPSRIMRLGGTVNYPSQDKLGRGYRMELTSVRTEFATERPFVSPELITQAYPQRHVSAANDTLAPLEVGQTTLGAMSRGTRIADLINACRQGDNWHNSMVRLTAHLASVGRTDAEILGLAAGITLPGYTVDQTLREMIQALRSARQKWAIPEPQDSVDAEEAKREPADSIFNLLDLDELEALPPPTWLIDGLISDHGLSIVYGDPGAGKSFVVLDMALRLSFGMDWHGTPTKRCGVLYIAGEGARGLGKRVKGWRREHGLEGADAPFLLLPVAVQLLDAKEREKLTRTIAAAIARAGFEIGLVIVDTVSRSIAGQDENGQEAMSLFVGACGEIQVSTGGAVIGVHHAGKDSSRGMRGSTVLLGGCDASLKVSKSEDQRVTIEVEKQKDDEEAENMYMMMKKVEWEVGLGKQESTLVPLKASAQEAKETKKLSRDEADQIFDLIDEGWNRKTPWALTPQSKRRGRYLPDRMADEFGITHDAALFYVQGWQQRDYLLSEVCDPRNDVSGLRVLKRLEADR
jgi:RecA-family ATPase